jgi:hypothetical protein
MPAHRTVRLLPLLVLLAASTLAGCSPAPADELPTFRQVRQAVAAELKKRPEHLILEDFHEDEKGRYSGTAEANSDGTVYQYKIEASVEGPWLRYKARGSNLLGEGPVLSGAIPAPLPTFRERHYELMQWLRAIAFVVQGLTVVWAVLGRFGLRRLYSPRVERVLVLVAAINLGFAMLWGYEFVTNFRGE